MSWPSGCKSRTSDALPLREPTADVQMRLDEAVAFEASIVAEVRAVAGFDWVFVDQTASPGLQVEATTPVGKKEASSVSGPTHRPRVPSPMNLTHTTTDNNRFRHI